LMPRLKTMSPPGPCDAAEPETPDAGEVEVEPTPVHPVRTRTKIRALSNPTSRSRFFIEDLPFMVGRPEPVATPVC
jgi:hypothetical protein